MQVTTKLLVLLGSLLVLVQLSVAFAPVAKTPTLNAAVASKTTTSSSSLGMLGKSILIDCFVESGCGVHSL